jgi:tryptophan 2,3-dioxygenase
VGDQLSGCPYHAAGSSAGGSDPSIYGRSDLTYNSYLKVEELLALQVPRSEPAHHDELLFIVIHQAYELWFKLVLAELDLAMRFMGEGQVLRAHHFLKRVCEVMKLLVQQIHVLETMAPADFLEFRDRLMPASGFQSLQFRELEFVAGLKDESYLTYFKNRPEMLATLERRLAEPDLRAAYYEMLRRLSFAVPENASELERAGHGETLEAILDALLPIYQRTEDHLALFLLTESLVEFDQYLSLWREHHVRVVERVIGFKRGTGGSSGAEYLRSTTQKRCFPLLWELRTRLKKRC